jgi:hypothetical protein
MAITDSLVSWQEAQLKGDIPATADSVGETPQFQPLLAGR